MGGGPFGFPLLPPFGIGSVAAATVARVRQMCPLNHLAHSQVLLFENIFKLYQGSHFVTELINIEPLVETTRYRAIVLEALVFACA